MFLQDGFWRTIMAEVEDDGITMAKDEGDCKVFQVMVPGYARDEIDILIEKEHLFIKSLVKKEGIKEFTYYMKLHTKIDDDNITAKLQHGVLTVRLPKLEVPKNIKHIKVD